MKARYSILVHNSNGNIVDYISDFISLKIIDIRNSVGSWTLSSQTKVPCLFQKGYGIVVFRNDKYYFSGYMNKVESIWSKESQSWSWTVTGSSNIGLLRWRVVFPPTARTSPGNILYFTSKYRKFGDQIYHTVENAIYDLINENLAYVANQYGDERGVPIVKDAYVHASSHTEFDTEVAYRFDNLYDVVMELLNECSCTLYAEWSTEYQKIRFVIRESEDLTDTIKFYESHDDMLSIKHIIQVPKYNYLTMSYNGDNEDAEEFQMWKYFESRYIDESQDWGARELFIAPSDEDFSSAWDSNQLYKLANQEVQKYSVADEGYEIQIASANGHIMFQSEYKLGDIVKIELSDGTEFSAIVEKVQTEVSYGKETVSTFIGVHDYGALNGIQTDISNLSSSVLRLSKK